MARLLGLSLGEYESPREITRTIPTSDTSTENGWLIRFFDSAFFCEWIAVSYLYKHDHPGVRDYLCNRMYTLPLSGIESYLFQVCYMLVHKPSPSLDKFVIDICSKSLQIALKVHWFLMAELEDSDDNEGISRIQEKCQIAATLMGEWPTLIRPQNVSSSPLGKNQVLNRLLSSKQRLLSLASSPPTQRSPSFSVPSGNSLQEDGSKISSDESKIFKKFMPGQKVRDALLFRKSVEKDDEETDKDGFFKRLLRDSKDEDVRKSTDKDEEETEKDGFFRRLLRDSKDEDEELTSSSEGFFKRLFRDKVDLEVVSKSVEDDEKEGFFRKLFKDKLEDKKDGADRKDIELIKSVEDDEKEGFFRKLFKDKFDDKKDSLDRTDEETKGPTNDDEEEHSDVPLFRRFFSLHHGDKKTPGTDEHSNGLPEGSSGSPGTEKFFRKLFRDRDRSVEDSEIFGSKKQKEVSKVLYCLLLL